MKRVVSLLVCLVLLWGMIPFAAPVHAASETRITVEADKTTVNPGDTVTFTVYLQSPLDIYGIQFFLDIPQGLTYVAGSGAVVSGIAGVLGVDGDCSWTEGSRQITVGSSVALKNIRADKLAIATFQCTVDPTATGKLTVNTTDDFDGMEDFGGFTVLQGSLFGNLPTSDYEMVGAEISVQTDPVFYSTVTASKSEAANGEEITFTVYIQSSVDIYGIHLLMDLPQGLTYVTGSGAVPSGLAATLGADGDCAWTENGLQITLASTAPLKNIRSQKLAVATFRCAVDSNAAGNLLVNTTTTSAGVENYGGVTVFQAGQFAMLPASHVQMNGAQVKVTSATHTWSAALSSDETGHWYACSHCAEKGSYFAHDFENACDPDCSVCGYTRQTSHVPASAWTTDANIHWHICSLCGIKLDEATHEPGAEATASTAQTCNICGYEIVPALGIAETTPAVTTDASTTPADTEPAAPSVTDAPAVTAPADGQDDASDGFPWWVLIVAAVILAGVAVVILVTPKKKR